MSSDDFDKRVIRRLQQQARRLRLCRAVEGFGVLMVVLFGALASQLFLDRTFRLRLDMRVVLLAVVVAIGLWSAWRYIVLPLRLRFGAQEMASELEKRFPQLDALLVSAVQFDAGNVGSPASNSPQLVASVIEQAATVAGDIPFDRVINASPARWAVLKTVAVLVAGAAALLIAPQTLGIWFDRNLLLRDVEWPKRTRIVADMPSDGVLRGAIGDDMEVRAQIEAGYVVPRQVELVYETRSGKTGREPMTGVGERGFRLTFPRVREEFRFHLTGGDDTTDWYATKLSQRPHIEDATLTIVAPAYTRIDPITLATGQRAADVYLGGTLTIRVSCSKPVVQATLLVGAEAVTKVEPRGNELTVSVSPTESQTYHFDLADADGLQNTRPVRFSARIIEDQAPKVRLQLPNVGNMVTRKAVLPVHVEFTDDLGLANAGLMYQMTREGFGVRTIPLKGFRPYDTSFDLQYEWAMASTEAEVGDQVSVFAQASDFDTVSGPNVGESTAMTFRIVTGDELLAEFNRREQEYRRQFERVVQSQERLRGKLLTLLGKMDEPSIRDDLELRLAPLERRQRQIVSQVHVIRQQFEQVLAEMAINRLDTSRVRERLGSGIVEPLTTLGTRELIDAADQLRRLGRERTFQMAQTVDPLQERILVHMRRVLDNMLKWEGYQETITMLREILRLQKELNAETQEEIGRQGGDVFED